MTPFVAAALLGLAAALVLAVLTWVASLIRHDVSLVDRVWGVMVALPAVAYAVVLPAGGPRVTVMAILVVAWALRLAAYVTWRNWGHGEDRRYQEIRARNQPHYPLKSLVLVFALQAGLAWLVSTPFLAATSRAAGWNGLDTVGAAVVVFGLAFETIGDWQLARFKARPDSDGQVMDDGLWRYTRHPNYFGEFCVWWGFSLMGLAAGGWWSLISPLVMTVLLLKVSGVGLLEKDIGERRPAYREYIARTNAFFPGPRRPARP